MPPWSLSVLLLLALSAVANVAVAATASTTFEETVAGAKCDSRVTSSGASMECSYTVGDLRFTIAGVGEEDAGISFDHSDRNGRYYGQFGVMHGCVTVWPGKANPEGRAVASFAFVSPRSGRVFRTWEECRGR